MIDAYIVAGRCTKTMMLYRFYVFRP